MAFTLHATHFHPHEYLRTHSDQALLAVYVVALAIVVIAMALAGISLIQQARSFPIQ